MGLGICITEPKTFDEFFNQMFHLWDFSLEVFVAVPLKLKIKLKRQCFKNFNAHSFRIHQPHHHFLKLQLP